MKKRLLAIALSVMVMFTIGAASSVFAAPDGANKANGDSYAAGTAKLVKYVQIPEGVDLTKDAMANKTFTFHFEPTAPDDSDYGVPASVFEELDVTSGKISEMSAGTTDADADTQNKVWSKSIAEVFANYTFPRAGEYTFTVSETSTAATGWEFAEDTYTLRLIVGNTGGITDVTVANEDGDKVDPSDVTPGDNTGGATPEASNGGFTFTNQYKPTVTSHTEPKEPNPDPDPDNPQQPENVDKTDTQVDTNSAFELDKFVLGEYGDQTKEFAFSVTVALPKGYKDFTLPSGWTDGTAKTVNLAHGDEFTFAELPVGTKITVSETAVSGYTTVWTTPNTDNGLVVTVSEDGGYAICRNSFDDNSITPTGIIINNLPYILLILIALGGIVLFARKRRYQ